MILSRQLVLPALLAAALVTTPSCQKKPGDAAPVANTTSVADSLDRMAALQRGQRAFLGYCAMCHGDGGNGDGDMAAIIQRRSGVAVARLNDRETLGRLSRAEIEAVIAKGGGHTGRSNLMPAWGERLDPKVIADIAGYVVTIADSNPAIPRSTLQHYIEAPAGVPAEGRVLFVRHCSACHGPFAAGDGPLAARLWQSHQVRPRNLTDSKYIAAKTDRELFATISLGGGHFRKAVQMPAWTVTLTPGQIRSVVAYVREVSKTTPRP